MRENFWLRLCGIVRSCSVEGDVIDQAVLPQTTDACACGAVPMELRTADALRSTAHGWKYPRRTRSRKTVAVALLVSTGLHALVLFAIGRAKKPAPRRAADDNVIALTITMPDLKELDEPELTVGEDAGEPRDFGPPPPTQADLPQLPRSSDFVQPVDISSLLPRPDFGDAKMFTISDHISRGGKGIAESIGNIFNLADLDRAPEPLLQMAPAYPAKLKKKGEEGTVRVEFVVDTRGNVISANVVESTNHGFDDVTLATVLKWRFRPGIRADRPVNVRMRVPIGFSLRDGLDAEI